MAKVKRLKSRRLARRWRWSPGIATLLGAIMLSGISCTSRDERNDPQDSKGSSIPAEVGPREVPEGEQADPGEARATDGLRTDAPSVLEERWGIRILGLRSSAGGYMLDFRYRVMDPEKAGPLFDRAAKPYLIDQATGARMSVPSPPKVGPLRTSDPPRRDRNYFVLFANPGRMIGKGSKTTVVIGDFRAEDLTVQ